MKNIQIKTKIKPALQYILKTILPIFLGGFLFAGALTKYNNVNNLNYTIVEVVLNPMRSSYAKCRETHKQLVYKKEKLAGSFMISTQILKKRLGKKIDIDPLLLDFINDSSAFGDIKQNYNDVLSLEKQLIEYYDGLYRIIEDGALFFNIYSKYEEIKQQREDITKQYEHHSQNALVENLKELVNENNYSQFLNSIFMFYKNKDIKQLEKLTPFLE